MGNKYCKKEKKVYKPDSACTSGIECTQDDRDEIVIPPVDSYGKLINWLLKMSEDEHIDIDDPDFVTKITQSAENKSKRQYVPEGIRPTNKDSTDACGGSEIPTYRRSPKSYADIEEENELKSIYPNYPAINLEADDGDDKSQNTLLVRPRGILMKQQSVSSESSECRTSGKSFDSDSEISDVLRIKEKILLQNRYQKFSRAKRQLQKQASEVNEPQRSNLLQVGGPVLKKQKSESCARNVRLSPRDFTDSKRYRRSSQSCNDIIDDRLMLPSPIHSRQTTLSDETNPCLSRQTTYSDERSPVISRQTTSSDERYPMYSRQTTFSEDDDGFSMDTDRRETIKLHDMASNINSVSFDDYRLCSNNRRTRRGRFSNTLSKSVGNLIDKSSRLKESIRKKSSSLFTIKQGADDEYVAQDPVDEQEKVLDDRLLDGNMGDILYAMDALWPKTSFT